MRLSFRPFGNSFLWRRLGGNRPQSGGRESWEIAVGHVLLTRLARLDALPEHSKPSGGG
jgi:hypothetical protein